MSLLTGKPVWFHWIFYVLLCGVIFGVSYGVITLVALRWWIAVLTILAAGITWGTIAFKKAAPDNTVVKDNGSAD